MKTNQINEISGVWICCGLQAYATGGSPQEAYNRYFVTAQQENKNPLEITACSLFLATHRFTTC